MSPEYWRLANIGPTMDQKSSIRRANISPGLVVVSGLSKYNPYFTFINISIVIDIKYNPYFTFISISIVIDCIVNQILHECLLISMCCYRPSNNETKRKCVTFCLQKGPLSAATNITRKVEL